jgi:hypothetical protein
MPDRRGKRGSGEVEAADRPAQRLLLLPMMRKPSISKSIRAVPRSKAVLLPTLSIFANA